MSGNPKRYALAICNVCDNTSDGGNLFHTPSRRGTIVNYLYEKVKENGFYFDSNDELKAFNEELSGLAKELYEKKYAGQRMFEL